MSNVTHIYPKMPLRLGERDAAGNFIPEPQQKPITNEPSWQVWEEIRNLTFEEEPGYVCVLTHDEFKDSEDHFAKQLQQDDVYMGKIQFAPLYAIERLIHKDGKTRTEVEKFPFNLGSKYCADEVIDRYRGRTDLPITGLVLWQPEEWGHLKHLARVAKACPDLPIYVFHGYHCDKYGVEREGGSRQDYSYSTLPQEDQEDYIEHLYAKAALTLQTAPSYTGKTHLAIAAGLSMVTGEPFLGHFPVSERIRVKYFVPELSGGRFKNFMERIAPPQVWKQHEDNFLVRPLECDLLSLDSAAMVEKCRGFYVFLDTLGYFTGVDNESSYQEAIKFATKVNHLIREGCLGVCGLYHPPKYSKNAKETQNILTIENQILGSAGYGGLLRSLLAMRNLNKDSNGMWVYVQGLKNPALGKPFQVKGFPLEYLGESPYLSDLLKSDSKGEQILAELREGKSVREICKVHKVSPNTVTTFKKQLEFDSEVGATANE